MSLAVAVAGCGQAGQGSGLGNSGQGNAGQLGLQAHPQVVEPVAGAAPAAAASSSSGQSVQVSGSWSTGNGRTPAQPVSTAVVREELAQSGISANPNVATLTPDGLAVAPIGAPAAVQEIINAGNQIARLHYLWGGGHGTFEDFAYDCSGSVSFVLAAAHLLNTTEVSGQLASYGRSGPGKWVTIFASADHVYMYVAGLRFDTVALAEYGSRWTNHTANDGGSYAVRHPPGL
ncbi:MAG TPA: hypothetical protein VGH24_03055 [Solirubrobacteraceae bacterium]